MEVHIGEKFEVSTKVIARKTLEAFWITAKKKPKINRTEECVAISNEMAPFLDDDKSSQKIWRPN